jgi:hypothetical protein
VAVLEARKAAAEFSARGPLEIAIASRQGSFDAKLRSAKSLDAADAMRRYEARELLLDVVQLADYCLDFIDLGSDLGARIMFSELARRARAAGATLKELVAARDAA